MLCFCESKKKFSDCCEPLLAGQKNAQTAEQLMRARYTAFTQCYLDFVSKTYDPETRDDTDF